MRVKSCHASQSLVKLCHSSVVHQQGAPAARKQGACSNNRQKRGASGLPIERPVCLLHTSSAQVHTECCSVCSPGVHTRALQASASSQPPPRAMVDTAATVGLGPLSISSQKASLMRSSMPPPPLDCWNWLMSKPAQKRPGEAEAWVHQWLASR